MTRFASWTCCVLLCVTGATPAAPPGPDVVGPCANVGRDHDAGPGLDCTNDFVQVMSCSVDAQNCSELSLTLRSKDGNGDERCVFHDCDVSLCCCSVHMLLVYGETHDATVWKGNKCVESKNISIKDSIKPKPPTLTVTASRGKVRLQWRTNMPATFSSRSAAAVTYHKKGDTKKVSKSVDAATEGGLGIWEIPERDLEPSTRYVVSVRSYTDWSHRCSDSSEPVEFTTGASSHTTHLVVIIALSAAAVVVTAAALGCFRRVKAKWSETVAKCPKPKLSAVRPAAGRGRASFNVLKPTPTDFSCVSVDLAAPDSGDLGSGGSPTDGGCSETGAGTFPLSCADVTPDVKAGGRDAGLASARFDPRGVRADGLSTDFDNMTYFTGSRPAATDESEVRHASVACVSTYQRHSDLC